jgi:hypothetical protein
MKSNALIENYNGLVGRIFGGFLHGHYLKYQLILDDREKALAIFTKLTEILIEMLTEAMGLSDDHGRPIARSTLNSTYLKLFFPHPSPTTPERAKKFFPLSHIEFLENFIKGILTYLEKQYCHDPDRLQALHHKVKSIELPQPTDKVARETQKHLYSARLCGHFGSVTHPDGSTVEIARHSLDDLKQLTR